MRRSFNPPLFPDEARYSGTVTQRYTMLFPNDYRGNLRITDGNQSASLLLFSRDCLMGSSGLFTFQSGSGRLQAQVACPDDAFELLEGSNDLKDTSPRVCARRFPFQGTAPPISPSMFSRMVMNLCEYQPAICEERQKHTCYQKKRRNLYV
jgi:hypothetical protein